ncbi:MAG: NAD-dependent epimerase/dehydratase family protein [Trueperaceae bacterium]
MELLFIGGSRFVGKHAVLEAVARGHSVTLFNRGNQPLPAGDLRHVQGDRNSDLERLAGETFDAVIDTSGYLPKQVRASAEALAGRVGAYLFVSSISVYADQTTPHQDEEAPLVELEDPNVEEITGETYGGLKVLCERALVGSFPVPPLVVRPGLVVGPDDPTDRFTYWPVRIGRGGEVLAPNHPGLPVQWIDARDLASWMIGGLERGEQGTFNAVSQVDRFSLGGLLEASRRITGSDARLTWVDEEFLLDHEVRPFVDQPLWIPGERANFLRIDGSRAHATGLDIRPMEDTISDTLEWYLSVGSGQPAGGEGGALKAGLDPERERELLTAWRAICGQRS